MMVAGSKLWALKLVSISLFGVLAGVVMYMIQQVVAGFMHDSIGWLISALSGMEATFIITHALYLQYFVMISFVLAASFLLGLKTIRNKLGTGKNFIPTVMIGVAAFFAFEFVFSILMGASTPFPKLFGLVPASAPEPLDMAIDLIGIGIFVIGAAAVGKRTGLTKIIRAFAGG